MKLKILASERKILLILNFFTEFELFCQLLRKIKETMQKFELPYICKLGENAKCNMYHHKSKL